jgi:hypothetical protein
MRHEDFPCTQCQPSTELYPGFNQISSRKTMLGVEEEVTNHQPGKKYQNPFTTVQIKEDFSHQPFPLYLFSPNLEEETGGQKLQLPNYTWRKLKYGE